MADVKITQPFDKSNQQDVLLKVSEDLLPIEEAIAAGGQQHTVYEKNRYEHVGIATNLFPPIRVQSNGKFKPSSVDIEGKGSFPKHTTTSYTEEVENTRFPCGTYSVMVGSRYDLSVGAGGIGIATGGNLKIGSGGRSNFSAKHEVNISSGEGNVDIKAGKNISLEGASLTLKTPNQIMIDGNLGVGKNAVINGCAFVDGELYINHVTCPAEVQYTGGGMGSFGQLMSTAGVNGNETSSTGGAIIGYADVSYIRRLFQSIRACNILTCIAKEEWVMPDKVPVMVCPEGGVSVASNSNPTRITNPQYSVFVYPHQHPFNNIPCTFTTGNETMRKKAEFLNNSGKVGTAGKIQHGYKHPVS